MTEPATTPTSPNMKHEESAMDSAPQQAIRPTGEPLLAEAEETSGLLAEDAVKQNQTSRLAEVEHRVYSRLFVEADIENTGVISGERAVKFFTDTKLEPRVLGEIWHIADRHDEGFLTPQAFNTALRLIGHCQAGRDPTKELVLVPAPIPTFHRRRSRSDWHPWPNTRDAREKVPSKVPVLTPDNAVRYAAIFEKVCASNEFLLEEQAKVLFEKSNLPGETLGRIWQLADTEERGARNLTEFIIARHLVASSKSGALRKIPDQVPGELYKQALSRDIRPTGPRTARQTENAA